MKRSGFTLTEVFQALFALFVLILMGGVIYAAIHFVLKFW